MKKEECAWTSWCEYTEYAQWEKPNVPSVCLMPTGCTTTACAASRQTGAGCVYDRFEQKLISYLCSSDALKDRDTMKQVTVNINDSKFQFFMELVNSLDFVQIDSEGDSKQSILSNIKKGLEDVRLAKQGKLRTTPAKDFLNEL